MTPPSLPARASARGMTLVELAVVCAVAAVLAGLAWPSWRSSVLKAGRGDAVEALMRLELAQARHRTLHGLYASDLAALHGVPQPFSTQGRYRVALEATDAEGWQASATALPGGPQAADSDCLRLTMEVRQGFTSVGPNARCWNR
jgi:type IV pilus assembly protein PilE